MSPPLRAWISSFTAPGVVEPVSKSTLLRKKFCTAKMRPSTGVMNSSVPRRDAETRLVESETKLVVVKTALMASLVNSAFWSTQNTPLLPVWNSMAV